MSRAKVRAVLPVPRKSPHVTRLDDGRLSLLTMIPGDSLAFQALEQGELYLGIGDLSALAYEVDRMEICGHSDRTTVRLLSVSVAAEVEL